MVHEILLPNILKIGANARASLPEVLQSLNCSRPLIVTDKTMIDLGYISDLEALLSSTNISFEVFADTEPEPTWASIIPGIDQAQTSDCDTLIAIGGGSPIDSAKAISVISKHGGTIRDYCVPNRTSKAGLPLIAIPTTAGTGSEVTPFTIITDETCDEKLLCAGSAFMPSASIIDYSLTLSLPPRMTADTGIDALTHAIEAYVSRKANGFSDAQAISALKLLGPNLRAAFHNGSDEQARENMMLGATLAGIAFANASVALVHGMSRPIGALFHVPHGLSNAMLLPSVTEYSIPSAEERYANCAKAMGIASHDQSTKSANLALLEELRALNAELSVPGPEAFGIDKSVFMSSLDKMTEQAFASGSPQNNPRIPTSDEMKTIYRSIW